MNGGVSHQDILGMKKLKFLGLLKRLYVQKKRENDEMEKASKPKAAPKGKMKYLGR